MAQQPTTETKSHRSNSSYQEAMDARETCLKLYKSGSKETIQICKNAVLVSKKAGLDSITIKSLNNIAVAKFHDLGAEAGHEYTLEAKQIAEASENNTLKMPAYYTYCLIWERYVDIENAVNLLNEALEIAIKSGDEYYRTRLISAIGYLFTEAELYEDARKYFTQALEIAKKENAPDMIALMETYLALSYRELGEYDKSKTLYKKSMEFYAKTDEIMPKTMIVFGLGKLEAKQGNYETSNDIFLGKTKTLNINISTKATKNLIASNYYNLRNYKEAIKYYKEIIEELTELTDKKIRKKVFRGIGDCYTKLGQFEAASTYYQMHLAEMDVFIKEKLRESITTADLKYRIKSQETEKRILLTEKENLALQSRSETLKFISSIIILALLILILIYWFHKQKNRNKFLKAVSVEQEKINENLLVQSQRKDIMNQKLTSRNKELSFFAGVVAHDIKAPIRTTSAFIKLIKKQIRPDNQVNEYIGFIENSNQRLNVLIDDLLEYTRSGQFSNKSESIDLNEIVHIVQSNLTHQINSKSATINSSDLPTIKANKTELIQLFQNIIANAIKFTRGRNPLIEIYAETERDFHLIIIKDNGIGIKKEYLDKIFNPLTKLHPASQFEGSGLGLATCKKIVEKIGGIIQVESNLNIGTTFSIKIPLILVQKSSPEKIYVGQ